MTKKHNVETWCDGCGTNIDVLWPIGKPAPDSGFECGSCRLGQAPQKNEPAITCCEWIELNRDFDEYIKKKGDQNEIKNR